MIYRFKSKLAVQDKLKAFPAPVPNSDKGHYGPWVDDYEEKFTLMESNKVVNLFDQTPSCKVFEAPEYDEGRHALALYFNEDFIEDDMPDIWGMQCYLIISDKVKEVIEAVDDMQHQYMPVILVDKDWNVLQSQQQYYWFNLRRFLTIQSDTQAPQVELDFFPIPMEEDFLFTLMNDSELSNKISQFPIWRHYCQSGAKGRYSQARKTIYFNENVYEQLVKAEVTGIELYSEKYGRGLQSLVPVIN